MLRCGGARKTFCGQVREHIVDFRDTKDTGYIIVMPGNVENRTVGHAVSRGDSHGNLPI